MVIVYETNLSSVQNLIRCIDTLNIDLVVVYPTNLTKIKGSKSHLVYFLHLKHWFDGGVPNKLTKG